MSNLSRRQFGWLSFGALVLAALPSLGCSVWTNIKNWVPVGIKAFNAILNLLVGAGVLMLTAANPITAIVGLITSGFSVISGAIDTYLSTTPPPVGALQTIETILTDIVANFQNFLAAITINDSKLSALVTGLADVILSTIAGFQAQLPAASAAAQRPFHVGAGSPRTVAPQKRSIRKFTHDWNKLCDGYGYSGAKISLSLKEHFE